MIPVSLERLALILDAQLIIADPASAIRPIVEVTTDTRKLSTGCLFIALKGERFDAHDFAEQALNAGAAALVVSRRLPLKVNQLIVNDTRIALGQLGAWVRSQSSARIVALTGSSGKTSVKEMTAAILRQCGEVLYTAGNLNNDIGVPLTLLGLMPEHQFAVVELGANHIGEIAYTTELVKPETALVNNIAAAHLEGFGSLAGVAQAKGEIFAGLPKQGVAIVNADSNDLPGWQSTLSDKQLWRFSSSLTADVEFYATRERIEDKQTCFVLHSPAGQIDIRLPLPGKHNIGNALAAAALAISVGASLAAVQAGLAGLSAVPGRLFPIQLAPQHLLLDDTYNANVGSMKAALSVLADMPGYRIMVVGDMGELGEESEDCHRQVGIAARQAGIDKVLSVGLFSESISHASGNGEHFTDKTALVTRLAALLSEHAVSTILVKGSRSAAMEQVVRQLQERVPC